MMAKISDEIRKWRENKCGCVDGDFVTKMSFDELMAIANRIDAEMMGLPKDRDGKTWTSREECFWASANKEGYHNFGCVALRDGRWYVEDVDGMYYEAESVWHERPDSLERIAGELEGLSVDSSDNYYVFRRASELADRIRKLAAKDGDYGPF